MDSDPVRRRGPQRGTRVEGSSSEPFTRPAHNFASLVSRKVLRTFRDGKTACAPAARVHLPVLGTVFGLAGRFAAARQSRAFAGTVLLESSGQSRRGRRLGTEGGDQRVWADR